MFDVDVSRKSERVLWDFDLVIKFILKLWLILIVCRVFMIDEVDDSSGAA